MPSRVGALPSLAKRAARSVGPVAALLAAGGISALAGGVWWAKRHTPVATPQPVQNELAAREEQATLSQSPERGRVPMETEGRMAMVSRATPVAPNDGPSPSLGLLTVNAVPFARVSLSGRSLGMVSGKKSFRLAPGPYEVDLKHPSEHVVRSVTILAGDERQVWLTASH